METSDWISYLKYLFEQVKLQQEVRDRWFRYYLIIAGAVLGTGIAIARLFYIDKYSQIMCLTLLTLSLAMGLIGLCFFMIYLRQRSNYIHQYKAIALAENILFTKVNQQESSLITKPLEPEQESQSLKDSFCAIRKYAIKMYGADYFTVWIHIIVNSLYFTSSLIFLFMLLNNRIELSIFEFGLIAVFFFFLVIWFEIIRSRNYH